MKLLVKGKTKDVYEIDEHHVRLQFKDDVTGADGVFDPGANHVGLSIEGVGNLGLKVTDYFFDLTKDIIESHLVAVDFDANTMDVKRCVPFGKGLEVICRMKAGGSFIRRYGAYIEAGADLDALVEFTLKDDDRNDPPASVQTLIALNLATQSELDLLIQTTKQLTQKISDVLASDNLVLHDIKYEYGYAQDKIILMDEISAGSMRVSENGEFLDPITLSNRILKLKTNA